MSLILILFLAVDFRPTEITEIYENIVFVVFVVVIFKLYFHGR